MTIRIRNKTWWYDGTDPAGRRVRVSLKTGDKAEASRLARELDRAALTGRLIRPDERHGMTLQQAYDKAWSLREGWREAKSPATLRGLWKHVATQFGATATLVGVDDAAVEQWVETMLRAKVSASQINARLSMLSVLRRAAKLAPLALPRQRPAKGRQRVYSVVEMDRIEQHFSAFQDCAMGALVLMLRETGARLGEILKAKPAHVQSLTDGYPCLVLHDTKGGYDRAVPLKKRARYAVQQGALPIALDRKQIQKRWSACRAQLALGDDALMHTYRHTSVTNMVATHGRAVSMAWHGHRSEGISKRYEHLEVGHLLAAAQGLLRAENVQDALNRPLEGY